MNVNALRQLALLGLLLNYLPATCMAQATKFELAKTVKIKPEERARFEKALSELDQEFKQIHTPALARSGGLPPGWADAEIGRKALRWILKYDEFYAPKFVGMTDKAISLTRERLKSLEKQAQLKPGFGTVLGYISSVDGSVQPYALYLPPDADKIKPTALLVVLHGRNQTLNEVSFIDAHQGKPYPKNELDNGMKRAVLHVYGRTNNAYRWAGEMDVHEAISDCIVRSRREKSLNLGIPPTIDLQGFSMGGAGAWHLGLHHSYKWRSVEAGAGFNETRNYARLKNVSAWVEKTLHIYDSYEVARNISAVPTIGYGGEEDPQLAASENIVKQLRAEGFALKSEGLLTTSHEIPFLRAVGAKMGHKVDLVSRKIMDEFVSKQTRQSMRSMKIDQVTYSLKYPVMAWIMLEKLDEHYRKTWVQAEKTDNGTIARINRIDNVTRLYVVGAELKKVMILDQAFDVSNGPFHTFMKSGDKWKYLNVKGQDLIDQDSSKRPNLQGPIDDAFTTNFVVIGPKGSENGSQHRLLKDFAANWSKYLRGDLPLTTADEAKFHPQGLRDGRNLVLFGTPKTNPMIARILPDLRQIKWSESEFTLGGKTYSTKDHIPALIAPNPLNPKRYVVINSGHTFGRSDFEGTNALLYPRMGDWGVLRVKPDGTTEVVDSGFFDEDWNGPK